MDPTTKPFTAADLATRWRVTTRTVANYLAVGILPEPRRFNGRRLWTADDVAVAEQRLAAREPRRGFRGRPDIALDAGEAPALTCGRDRDK